MKKIKDKELAKFQSEIGADEYRKICIYVTNKSVRLAKNDIRFSKKHYANSPEKLETIKEKYKDGVTMEILEEFVSKFI